MSNQAYKIITDLQSEVTFKPAATLTTLVGNKGSGKNVFFVQAIHDILEVNPKEKILSNTKITETTYIPDLLKFLAMKLLREDDTYCEVFIDEAAMAGLEARGSFSAQRALDSYLFTLSRKVNANIFLSSQLLSMIEKRSQWISDFYILCQAEYDPPDMPFRSPLPAFFNYTVYDENLREINNFEIDGEDARHDLYQRYRTQEIPFTEERKQDFIAYYKISPSELELYDEVMGIKREKTEQEPPKVINQEIFDSKYKHHEDETVVWQGKHWKITGVDILPRFRDSYVKRDGKIEEIETVIYRHYLSEIA